MESVVVGVGSRCMEHGPAVELYWRPGCVFCSMLRHGLRRVGLSVREVNIWNDAAAAARVRSVAGGNETVPTVFVGRRAVVNPTVGQVLTLVCTEAPELLPDPRSSGDQPTRRLRWPRWLRKEMSRHRSDTSARFWRQ